MDDPVILTREQNKLTRFARVYLQFTFEINEMGNASWGSTGNVYALLFPYLRWPERKKCLSGVRYWAIPEFHHVPCEACLPYRPTNISMRTFLATPRPVAVLLLEY